MDSCLFCKISQKKVPNHTVYEDNNVLAFLDIYPLAKGHTVVIPKEHAQNLQELSDDSLRPLFQAVKQTTNILQKTLNPDGFNIGWNHGEVAGQTIPHLHVHIIPRWSNDGGKSLHAIIKNPGDTSVEDIAKLF